VIRTTGRLLVAEPLLGDPNFQRTVVLVIEHTAEGALGLVLNRPTEVFVAEALPAWRNVVSDPPVLHVGGPVEERSGWCLARAVDPDGLDGFVPVLGDLGLLDLGADPDGLVGVVTDCRVYAGYSGWGAGQLDHELSEDAWIVVDAEPDDPFVQDPRDLWQRILERQGGSLARLVHFPPDPTVN
jgi:putative transcriptional regulator